MDPYVTGSGIRELRERKGLTQAALAELLTVSDKTVSKWETGRGLPDISLLEPLAAALSVSVSELLAGQSVVNKNISGSMLRSQWYVCPVCGNILHAMGGISVSCCGIALPPLEAETPNAAHMPRFEKVEDEWYVCFDHPMEKTHYISFMAAFTDGGCELLKLYPEGSAGGRFKMRGLRRVLFYCNRHGLFTVLPPKKQ